MSLPIVRLQIQLEPLKQGEKPHRWYDPSAIRSVDRLRVDADGVTAVVEGTVHHDVHHVAHPRSRNHGRASGLSVGFTSHYAAMRERFGERVADGVAGENVLVDAEERMTRDRLSGGALRTGHGALVRFDEVHVAEPCVEFSRYVLGIEPGDRRTSLREPLQQLMGGIRGFYVALAEPVELGLGDEIILD